MMIRCFFTTLVILAALPGCDDFASPAELLRPQVLGIRAEFPAIPAGERTELTIRVAGPEGDVIPTEVDWALGSPVPEAGSVGPAIGEPIGAVDVEPDGAVFYQAPDEVEGGLGLAAVHAIVRLEDGSELVAVKAIGVGVPVATSNPTIREIRVNGVALPEADPVALRPGASASLEVEVAPAEAEAVAPSFAWFATIGEIELFHQAAAEIVAPAEPGDGWIYLVYRDGLGGLAWRQHELAVE